LLAQASSPFSLALVAQRQLSAFLGLKFHFPPIASQEYPLGWSWYHQESHLKVVCLFGVFLACLHLYAQASFSRLRDILF